MQNSLSDHFSSQGHLKRSGQSSRETAQQLGIKDSNLPFPKASWSQDQRLLWWATGHQQLGTGHLPYHLLGAPTFPSLKAKDRDVLLLLLLLFGASSQEAGVTHSS